MPSDRALVAHVLRRTSFGPFPGQLDELAPLGAAELVERQLAAEPPGLEPPDAGRPGIPPEEEDEDPDIDRESDLVSWWLDRMSDPAAGLHEKLVWFWHSHFTSSLDQVEAGGMWQQQETIRRLALGDFRELVHEMTVDPVMLIYLSGDGSVASAPNENYARELMELFTLGRGNYAQADVAAAAKALAGWWVDVEAGASRFDPSAALRGSVPFLGRRAHDAADVVDIVCDQPACARFVAAKLHRFLVGTDPSPQRTEQLASTFAGSGLLIRALVEEILRHPDFLRSVRSRPRFPVEWLVATTAVTGWERDDDGEDPRLWWLESMGQLPFEPPNVAGWPLDDRWLSASQWMARAAIVAELRLEPDLDPDDPVGSVLELTSTPDVGPATRAALEGLADRPYPDAEFPRAERDALLLALALTSPEASLA